MNPPSKCRYSTGIPYILATSELPVPLTRSRHYCCACGSIADIIDSRAHSISSTPQIQTRCSNRFCKHISPALLNPTMRHWRVTSLIGILHRGSHPTPTHSIECSACEKGLFVEIVVWVCWACTRRNVVLINDPESDVCIRCGYMRDRASVVGLWRTKWILETDWLWEKIFVDDREDGVFVEEHWDDVVIE